MSSEPSAWARQEATVLLVPSLGIYATETLVEKVAAALDAAREEGAQWRGRCHETERILRDTEARLVEVERERDTLSAQMDYIVNCQDDKTQNPGDELLTVRAERDRLAGELSECCRLAGGAPGSSAVAAVKAQRERAEEDDELITRSEAEITRLAGELAEAERIVKAVFPVDTSGPFLGLVTALAKHAGELRAALAEARAEREAESLHRKAAEESVNGCARKLAAVVKELAETRGVIEAIAAEPCDCSAHRAARVARDTWQPNATAEARQRLAEREGH